MKGFYLAGCFDKGKKPSFMILSQSEKPFKVDSVRGVVEPRGIPSMSKCRYWFADEWEFLEGYSINEITVKGFKDNPILANAITNTLNEIWAGWCNKYNRKYFPLFGETK